MFFVKFLKINLIIMLIKKLFNLNNLSLVFKSFLKYFHVYANDFLEKIYIFLKNILNNVSIVSHFLHFFFSRVWILGSERQRARAF